jgi:hypothetical protein
MHSKRGRNTNLYTMACGDLNREKKRFWRTILHYDSM